MSKNISLRAKKITVLLAMVYFTSYILRKNFSVMLAAITASGFDAVALGAVGSAMTVSYGFGQIINGILGDKIKPQYMISCGLLLAGACNFAMSFCSSVSGMAVIWFINGFAHAMLWPPIVRLMAMFMNDSEYGYATVRIYCASSIATIILYLLSPLLLNIMDWNRVILCLAIVGTVISVLWLIINPRLFPDVSVEKNETEASLSERKTEVKAVPLPTFVRIPAALIFFAIIMQGALRDGVGDWMPTFMADAFGFDSGSAIISGVIPAIFSILSFIAFDLLHRKLLKNEVACAAVIFVGAAVCSIILLILNTIAASGFISAIFSALLIGILVACMHGINLMLITVVPKSFIKSGKVSTFSGILNAATYIGAAIALPLFPALKTNFSWSVTIAVWAIISALGALACFASYPMWKRFKKEYSDNASL